MGVGGGLPVHHIVVTDDLAGTRCEGEWPVAGGLQHGNAYVPVLHGVPKGGPLFSIEMVVISGLPYIPKSKEGTIENSIRSVRCYDGLESQLYTVLLSRQGVEKNLWGMGIPYLQWEAAVEE